MELIADNNEEISFRILKVMNKIRSQSIEYEFAGNEYRYKAATVSFLITENNADIGFIYLTDEDKKNMFFLDISLLKKYRGHGIGFEAIKELLKRYKNCGIKKFILAEVEYDNEACNKMMNKLGCIKVSEKHYLMQPERLKEFRDFIINESVDLMTEAPKIKDVIEQIHENKGQGKVKKLTPPKNDN